MKKQYSSYQETIDFLTQCMGEHPQLIRIQSIGETWEKRPIMMATISQDVAYANLKPAMLYTGSIHAREWIGNELAIKLIKYIIENYQTNPILKRTLTCSTLYIVPCLNPDGFEYSRSHFSFWRKNRRNNGDGTFGVDLNRNFSVRFKKGTDPGSTTYSGPAAFSEPETRAIKEFINAHNNITIALDYHSQGNVFFPAHKFNHEIEIDGTDINILCANMNHEIKKVTGRQYGINRGKPPGSLIHGSGREYYYSKGVVAIVVEVGTQNIPDYMQNMSESVDENIPAILYVASEVINYSNLAPKRIENFVIDEISTSWVRLNWEFQGTEDYYFEVYRSDTYKNACNHETLIATTKNLQFTDIQLKSGKKYYYNIRCTNRITQIKSPFSPEIRLKTLLTHDQFSITQFPNNNDVGYVGEYTLNKNSQHFGLNSLFIGIDKRRGICYGVVAFSLDRLPRDALVIAATLSLYPMNRTGAKIEKYGEWSVSIIDPCDIPNLSDFHKIHSVKPIHSLGETIESYQLTQGVWKDWNFNIKEREILQQQADSNNKILFRIEGPNQLPLGKDSQIMQFDIGYGRFGNGIHYRPNLEIIYTRKPQILEIHPTSLNTIYKENIISEKLASGFDKEGEIVYGQMAFTFDALPDPDCTVITEAYLLMQNKNSLTTKKDIRFTIELAELNDPDFVSIKQHQKIEYIGYEVSNSQLKDKSKHHFIFDSFCRQELERLYSENKTAYFIIHATALYQEKNNLIDWFSLGSEKEACLIIKYIERRKKCLPQPIQLDTSIENNLVKLTWKNPENIDFVGSYAVRNCFHPPKSPFDGVKLYAGKDEYTYDSFGNANIPKFYAVFSYDNVPNYSIPACIQYSVKGTYIVEEGIDDDNASSNQDKLERSYHLQDDL